MANISQKVIIDGIEYELKGKVDFTNMTIKKVNDNVPDPEPSPRPEPNPSDPTKPVEGTVKEGGWGANLSDKNAWHVVNMRDFPEQFKVVDAAGKNVATNFTKKETAEGFIAYFKVNPFPPVDTTNPTPEPGPEPTPTPPVTGSGTDKYGVKFLASNGQTVVYEVKNNFRDDGKRFDMKGGDDWTQSEITGYFRFTQDPVDDEVSAKWSQVPHSGSNMVNCYDSGVSVQTGKSRLRMELKHPEYSSALATGQGVPLNDKFIGYKGIKTVGSDGSVTIELYQDTGDNETKPSNTWKKIFSHKDTKYKITGAHPYLTLRIDDPAKQGQKNLEAKWISCAKI
jgi:hypothetical protein